jgi:hypothetical protein
MGHLSQTRARSLVTSNVMQPPNERASAFLGKHCRDPFRQILYSVQTMLEQANWLPKFPLLMPCSYLHLAGENPFAYRVMFVPGEQARRLFAPSAFEVPAPIGGSSELLQPAGFPRPERFVPRFSCLPRCCISTFLVRHDRAVARADAMTLK